MMVRILLGIQYLNMAKKRKIKVTIGPCPYCGGNEIIDRICFYCGKLINAKDLGEEKNMIKFIRNIIKTNKNQDISLSSKKSMDKTWKSLSWIFETEEFKKINDKI